jgi:hypothetical protein
VLTNFQVSGTASLRENSYTIITMYGVTVQCPSEGAGQTWIKCQWRLATATCNGTVLLLDCEILGGRETLFIAGAPKVHIKGTEICLRDHEVSSQMNPLSSRTRKWTCAVVRMVSKGEQGG